MNAMLLLLWLAGLVQILIAVSNLFLPRKLHYQENLGRVTPIIRQVFLVHSAYIVGVLLLFAALTLGFAPELASGHGLGRFLAAGIALFWLFRAPVQILYYDASLRRMNRLGDIAFTSAAIFLTVAYAAAALGSIQ
jgi:hypothetical protein